MWVKRYECRHCSKQRIVLKCSNSLVIIRLTYRFQVYPALEIFFNFDNEKQVMVRDELQQFIQSNDGYKDLCSRLLDSFHLDERTVAAFTRCGTNTGTSFLSDNFSRVFGYPRKIFIAGDLQFLINHMHPEDLPAFILFAETSTLNATPWSQK